MHAQTTGQSEEDSKKLSSAFAFGDEAVMSANDFGGTGRGFFDLCNPGAGSFPSHNRYLLLLERWDLPSDRSKRPTGQMRCRFVCLAFGQHKTSCLPTTVWEVPSVVCIVQKWIFIPPPRIRWTLFHLAEVPTRHVQDEATLRSIPHYWGRVGAQHVRATSQLRWVQSIPDRDGQ